jgi:hypothetical protein
MKYLADLSVDRVPKEGKVTTRNNKSRLGGTPSRPSNNSERAVSISRFRQYALVTIKGISPLLHKLLAHIQSKIAVEFPDREASPYLSGYPPG